MIEMETIEQKPSKLVPLDAATIAAIGEGIEAYKLAHPDCGDCIPTEDLMEIDRQTCERLGSKATAETTTIQSV